MGLAARITDLYMRCWEGCPAGGYYLRMRGWDEILHPHRSLKCKMCAWTGMAEDLREHYYCPKCGWDWWAKEHPW